MNTTLPAPAIERPWLTYAKAVLFILPAIAAWGFARAKLMPLAVAICDKAGFEPSHLGHSAWVWPATFLLAEWGPALLVAGIVIFALMELARPRWWRRRLALGIGTWVANLAVLLALSVLLTIILLVAAGLTRQ